MTLEPPAAASSGPEQFTAEEQEALELAAELSDRARRGRETVRRLKAHLEEPAPPDV